MSVGVNGWTTGIALVLAATAAIMSAPGHAERSSQLMRWLQASAVPEAEALAGAIGATQEKFVAP